MYVKTPMISLTAVFQEYNGDIMETFKIKVQLDQYKVQTGK